MIKLITVLFTTVFFTVLANASFIEKHELLDLQSQVLKNAEQYVAETNKSQAKAPSFKSDEANELQPNTFSKKQIYIFVSTSIPEKTLIKLSKDALIFNAALVLRGLKDNSYTETAKMLQRVIEKTGSGFLVDPELFDLYEVKEVPTFVVADDINCSDIVCKPRFNKILGNVSLRYAMQKIAASGELGMNKND